MYSCDLPAEALRLIRALHWPAPLRAVLMELISIRAIAGLTGSAAGRPERLYAGMDMPHARTARDHPHAASTDGEAVPRSHGELAMERRESLNIWASMRTK
jgi:hypothetical protein